MQHAAIAVTAREKVELIPLEYPAAFGPADIRGPTLFSCVSPGTELALNYCGSKFPNYPGYAAAFVADRVGAGVKTVKPGDLLVCMSNHRSFQQMAEPSVVKAPEGMDPRLAPLARLVAVSMTTLVTTKARPGDRVIVTGAGPIGFLAAQIFAVSGYDVHVVEPQPRRREWMEQAGQCRVYPRMPLDDAALQGHVALVLECSGHEQAALDACRIVRPNGEVVLVGVPWKRQTDLYAHEILHQVFQRYVILRSGWEWKLPEQPTPATPHSLLSNIATALRWLHEGRIRAVEFIRIVAPRDVQAVYQDLQRGTFSHLFAVFDWQTRT